MRTRLARRMVVVLAVVVLNSLIGFVQEYRASRAIEALRGMVPEYATVLRDGQRLSVPVADIVPGDVVQLASGDKVPADLRLAAVKNLRVEEAALADPAAALDQLPVHHRDLAGGPAEAHEAEPRPKANRLPEGRRLRSRLGLGD